MNIQKAIDKTNELEKIYLDDHGWVFTIIRHVLRALDQEEEKKDIMCNKCYEHFSNAEAHICPSTEEQKLKYNKGWVAHSSDCTFYDKCVEGCYVWNGVCTCGFGLSLFRERGRTKEMISKSYIEECKRRYTFSCLEKKCKCLYISDCDAIEMIKSPSGREWAIGGTETQDRFKFCPWCGGKI